MAVTTLEKVKSYLGIKISTSMDDEINSEIASAKKDMERSGMSSVFIDEADESILNAIKYYCTAHYPNQDPLISERAEKRYKEIIISLVISGDYRV